MTRSHFIAARGIPLVLSVLLSVSCSQSGSTDSTSTTTSGGSGSANAGSSGSTNTTCPMGTQMCGALCVDTQKDEDNCGACGTVCAAGQSCVSGMCKLLCPAGLVPCSGRCVDPLRDTSFCGATGECGPGFAGVQCSPGEVCNNGTCELNCGSRLIACDDACVNPDTDPDYCGADGDCTGNNAGEICGPNELCNNGTCTSIGPGCSAPFVQCGSRCVDPTTDNQFCGASGDCTGANDGTTCSAGLECFQGTCQLNCPFGQVACGGTCVNPSTDRSFCGAGTNCTANPGVACDPGENCLNGTCQLVCPSTQVACNGTCVDPSTDEAFCGASGTCSGFAAGRVCAAGESCLNGVCTLICPTGTVKCNGQCINPMSDQNFCGATGDCNGSNRGRQCAPGTMCDGMGNCDLTCQPGFIACGNSCIDPMTDETFCGASNDCTGANDGNICSTGQSCINGACQLICPTGQIACNNTCVNPQTDNNFCGATGNCVGTNDGNVCAAGTQCQSGTCTTVCPSGQVKCNGTCIDPRTNPQFCGATGACDTDANNGVVCGSGFACNGSGQCTLNCQAGLLNCGGQCVDPQTNREFCGARLDCAAPTNSGTRCGSGQVCSSGMCVTSCPSGTVLCNGTCVNPQTDRNYCGAVLGSDCSAPTNDGNVCASNQICNGGMCVNAVRKYLGSLPADDGRWTYQGIVGTAGAQAECRVRFGSTAVVCSFSQLQTAEMQGELKNPVDYAMTPVSAWWIDDPTAPNNRRCVNYQMENVPWSYATGHLGVGGYYCSVDRTTGALQYDTSVMPARPFIAANCNNAAPMKSVACCNP